MIKDYPKRVFCKHAILLLGSLLIPTSLFSNEKVNKLLLGNVTVNGKKISKDSYINLDKETEIITKSDLAIVKNNSNGFLIRPNTKIRFFENKIVELIKGSVHGIFGKQENELKIKTPRGNIGIRGTVTYIEHEESYNRTYVCNCYGETSVYDLNMKKLKTLISKYHSPVIIDKDNKIQSSPYDYPLNHYDDNIANIVKRNPKRFIGLGTVPMQNSSLAIQELIRCKEIGLRGIQIGSHINDWNLDRAELFPIFQKCEELEMSIFVHPWDMMGKEKMEKYWLPWLVGMPAETSLAICSMIFGGVFERLPNLKVAFAHGGGSFPATIGRIEHGFNVRPDLCAIDNNVNPRDYLGNFYLDSLVHEPKMLDFIVDIMGEDKICLGTDYPFPLGELESGKLINEMKYTNAKKAKLLAENALNWLGINKEDFI